MHETKQPASASGAVRIVLANEHALVRAGVRALIDEQSDIRVVAEAQGPEEALAELSRTAADVVLLESDPSARPWIERIAALPGVRVLAMTHNAEPEGMLDALRSGARGAIPKTASTASLSEALRAVARGLRWLTPDLERYCRHHLTSAAEQTSEPAKAADEDWQRLTPRERQIAELVGHGLRHAEIAERLGISIHTVKNHLRHVFVKLDVAGRVELAMYVRG